MESRSHKRERYRKRATEIGLALAVSFGAASSANAITMEEFDNFAPEVQDKIIADALEAYYKHYDAHPDTKYKAACMINLYNPVVDGGGPHLLNLILQELDIARADTEHKYTVEGIVEGIIDRECKPGTEATGEQQ